MGTIPFAFSVSHFINSVGSDAGFASIIGLAVLVLLYFAHARETASLRAHAVEAAERIQQLEARLAQLSRSLPAPAPAPGVPAAVPGARAVAVANAGAGAIAASRGPTQRPVGVPADAVAPALAGMGAPAGMAAPALAAATKLIPTASPAGAVALAPGRPGAGTVAPGPPAGRMPAPARPGDGMPAPARPGDGMPAPARPGDGMSAPARPGQGSPAPATVAGGANRPAGTNGVAQEHAFAPRPPSAPTGAQAPPPRVQIRPGAGAPSGRRPVPPPRGRSAPAARRGRPRRGLAVLLAVIGVIAIVAVLLIVTSGASPSRTATSTSTTNALTRQRASRRSGVVPGNVTVAVLNGTVTTGLAGRVSTKLAAGGYKKGSVATASDQTHASTLVGYLPGFKADAVAVAKTLGLSSASVQPVDQQAQAVACPPSAASAACNANVIVTVGSDLTNIP